MIPKRKEPSYEMSRHKTILIILLFIVSTMLIGILTACEGIGDDTGTPLDTSVKENTNPFYWEYTPELEPLTQEQVDACNQALRLYAYGTLEEFIATWPPEKHDNAIKVYNEARLISTSRNKPYLGTFNEAIVAASILQTMEATEFVIANHTIYFSTGAGISVYRDGEIKGIENAYEAGWLTENDIGIISERVKKYYSTLFNGGKQ